MSMFQRYSVLKCLALVQSHLATAGGLIRKAGSGRQLQRA